MTQCPYVGLDPFGPEHADFFFARTFERDTVLNNLMAARLTLFYGASGVGKSSVLGAGVLHSVRESVKRAVSEGEAPAFIACVFPSLSKEDSSIPKHLTTWTSDPATALLDSLQREIVEVAQMAEPSALERSGSLAQTLKEWSRALRVEFLVILDQFEEYFLYHDPHADGGDFARELAQAIAQPGGGANFLVSIREDALAKLERLKGLIPNLFGNYLRIDHLDRQRAREAILGPIGRYNELLGPDAPKVTIGEGLVTAILDGVRPLDSVPALRASPGSVSDAAVAGTGEAIDTSYLQLVLTRLWAEEVPKGSSELRLETLQRLGGVDALVRRHLDEATAGLSSSQRRVAARVLGFLVTPEGSKIALTAAALADWTRLRPDAVAEVLTHLAGKHQRVLRSVPGDRFELYHDRLAPPVQEWTRKARDREERGRLVRRLAGIAGVLLAAGVATWVWAHSQEWRIAAQREGELRVADDQMREGYHQLSQQAFERAAALTNAAAAAYRRHKETKKEAEALLQVGKALELAHKPDQASRTYDEVERLVGEQGWEFRGLYGRSRERRAVLRESAEGFPAAEPDYLAALQAFSDGGDPLGSARIRERLALGAEEARKIEEARDQYRDAGDQYVLAGDQGGAMRVREALRRLSVWGFLFDLHTGQVSALSGEQVTVGRDVPEQELRNDISIAGNQCVSRRHLLIRGRDRTIEELRSRSGTAVDGIPLRYGDRVKLADGDILALANGHAMQFTLARPRAHAVPANAWAIFVDGSAKRALYLTEASYVVSLQGTSLQVGQSAQGEALLEVRRAAEGTEPEVRGVGSDWQLYVEYKDPNSDYNYQSGFVTPATWVRGLNVPARIRKVGPDGKSAVKDGPSFQIVPMQASPGCEPRG